MDVDLRKLVGRGLHNITVVVGLHEVTPDGGRPARRRHRWQLDRLADVGEDLVHAGEAILAFARYVFPQDEVVFLDLHAHFLNADGSLKSGLFVDGTHLSASGYEVLADAIEPVIDRLIQAE